MKRARNFALAMLFAAGTFGSAPAFAQAPMAYPPPPGPYGSPAPMVGVDCWDECANLPVRTEGAYGPLAIIERTFLRAEYLNWNIKDPGSVLLGAPVLNVGDPAAAFPIFDPGTSNIIATAQVPTTSPIGLNDVNGIRATAGGDLTYGGSFEIGAFLLENKQSGFNIDVPGLGQAFVVNPGNPLSGHLVPQLVGTSVLTAGQVSDTVLLYNQSFSATYQSQFWGAEANYIGDFDREGLFWLNPIFGVRYFNLHERLNQVGVFQDSTIFLPPVVSTIESVTYNNLYGPQIGGRLEMMTKYVQLGLDSKLMLLGNTMSASVASNHLRSNLDPRVATTDTTTNFSLGVDVGCYGQINIARNFSLRVGYNFFWFAKVTRPEDNIFYNDNGVTNPPGIVTHLTRQDIVIHGVSVGGEVRF